MNNQLDDDLLMTINKAIIIIIDAIQIYFFEVFLQFVQQIDALQECVCITAGFMHLWDELQKCWDTAAAGMVENLTCLHF